MTAEKSIKIIEVAKAECEWNAPLDYQEAFNMAIEALEKQIPKKPLQDKKPRYGMGYEYYDWVCPTCGHFLAPEPQKIGNHHCKCGQAIDWTEGEK